MQKLLVWDRHTRLFHWSLVVCFSFSIGSGLWNDMDVMEWHMVSGYTLLTLIIFRLLTGIVGKDYANFLRFPLAPNRVIAYIKGERQFYGHNPLGSWMIVIMLSSIIVQITSGLMTSDDIFVEGPWVIWVTEEWVSVAGSIHGTNYYVLLFLVISHILAIVFYKTIKKQNLVAAMITGKADKIEGLEYEESIVSISLLRISLLAAIAGGISWYAVTFS